MGSATEKNKAEKEKESMEKQGGVKGGHKCQERPAEAVTSSRDPEEGRECRSFRCRAWGWWITPSPG